MTTKTLLDAATAFLKAWVAVAIVATAGILAAPNLDGAVALGIAALAASIGAGIAALQTFVPAISVRRWLEEPIGSAIDAGLHAGIGFFLVSVTGWLAMPDLSTWRSLVSGVLAGAIAAFLRAFQAALFGDETYETGLRRGVTRWELPLA